MFWNFGGRSGPLSDLQKVIIFDTGEAGALVATDFGAVGDGKVDDGEHDRLQASFLTGTPPSFTL